MSKLETWIWLANLLFYFFHMINSQCVQIIKQTGAESNETSDYIDKTLDYAMKFTKCMYIDLHWNACMTDHCEVKLKKEELSR